MQRKHIIYVVVAVVLMAAVFAGAYIWTDMGMKGNRAGTSQTNQESTQTPDASSGNVDEQDIVELIHLMSNSLIQAGDNQVWGTEEVNKANIEKVLDLLDQIPVNTRTKKLREIVVMWKQGDFSQIVDDHNYVWELLGGNVGWATSANDKAVAEAIANLEDSGQ
jgi:flagellar basal body-associated protein FliL